MHDPAARRGFFARFGGPGSVASSHRLNYAWRMLRSAALVCLLLPALAHAVICKTVDDEGVVNYADVPAAECANPVKLPDYSRYSPRTIRVPPPTTSKATAVPLPFDGYQSMQVIAPENEGTVRSNEGQVSVGIALQPDLQPGHLVRLQLDGETVSGKFDSVGIQLSGVDRGTHSLEAAIVDGNGRTLIEAPTVRFTLRKIGLYDRPSEPENPIERNGGDGEGGESTSEPAEQNPTSFPATPGGNAAFAPNYRP